MRFILKVLIGFIIFNACLILLAGYFETADPIETSSPSSKGEYQLGQIDYYTIIGVFTGIFAVVIIGSLFIKNAPTGQFIGAGAIVALIAGLWAGTTKPLLSVTDSYPQLSGWYDLFMIVFGIIAVISVIEIFTPKGSED